MTKEVVEADGSFLFNFAMLAVEKTVRKPQEIRKTIVNVMISYPESYSNKELGLDSLECVKRITSGSCA